MKSLYAIVLDAGYLVRALCLYRSFRPFLGAGKQFAFYCIDDRAADLLERLELPDAWIIRPDAFETEALRQVRPQRATNEYCWTCKPAVLLDAFGRDPSLDWVVYLDGDMMAFADPDQALVAAGAAAVVLTPHRYADAHFAANLAEAGQFNGGYLAARNSTAGREVVSWWLARCLECCPNRPRNGLYADQKYLEQMPGRFAGVFGSDHRGLNAAPWNIAGCRVAGAADGQVRLDDQPLLIYHFQGLRIHGDRLFDLYADHVRLPAAARNLIYRPYLHGLRRAFRELRQVAPGFAAGIEPLHRQPRRLLSHLRRLPLGTSNLLWATG